VARVLPIRERGSKGRGGCATKPVILLCLLLSLSACAHFRYEAGTELKNHEIESSTLSSYDMVIGIQFRDQTEGEITEAVKGDLAAEMAQWVANLFDGSKTFKTVVNLNENRTEEVDVILRGIIESIQIEEPGISGKSIALAIISVVALVFDHYAVPKVIGSSATVDFQLIEPESYKLLWNKSITQRVKSKIRVSQSNKLIFTSVTKAVEALLTETDLPEALAKMERKPFPTQVIAAQ
jgi:hypothetical protein